MTKQKHISYFQGKTEIEWDSAVKTTWVTLWYGCHINVCDTWTMSRTGQHGLTQVHHDTHASFYNNSLTFHMVMVWEIICQMFLVTSAFKNMNQSSMPSIYCVMITGYRGEYRIFRFCKWMSNWIFNVVASYEQNPHLICDGESVILVALTVLIKSTCDPQNHCPPWWTVNYD